MIFEQFSFRHAEVILNQPEFVNHYHQLRDVIRNISDSDIIHEHQTYMGEQIPKSLSVAINSLFRERLVPAGWISEPAIFQDPLYREKHWRLDFALEDKISIEVAFNHGEAIAWNLIKPVLASELNHVRKDIQTQIGVIITVTESMRTAGGFDSAVGTYEKFLRYLNPLRNLLTVPILIMGLLPPDTFYITHETINRKKHGMITMIRNPQLSLS